MNKEKLETLIRNCLSRKLSVQKIDSLAPMIAEYGVVGKDIKLTLWQRIQILFCGGVSVVLHGE